MKKSCHKLLRCTGSVTLGFSMVVSATCPASFAMEKTPGIDNSLIGNGDEEKKNIENILRRICGDESAIIDFVREQMLAYVDLLISYLEKLEGCKESNELPREQAFDETEGFNKLSNDPLYHAELQDIKSLIEKTKSIKDYIARKNLFEKIGDKVRKTGEKASEFISGVGSKIKDEVEKVSDILFHNETEKDLLVHSVENFEFEETGKDISLLFRKAEGKKAEAKLINFEVAMGGGGKNAKKVAEKNKSGKIVNFFRKVKGKIRDIVVKNDNSLYETIGTKFVELAKKDVERFYEAICEQGYGYDEIKNKKEEHIDAINNLAKDSTLSTKEGVCDLLSGICGLLLSREIEILKKLPKKMYTYADMVVEIFDKIESRFAELKKEEKKLSERQKKALKGAYKAYLGYKPKLMSVYRFGKTLCKDDGTEKVPTLGDVTKCYKGWKNYEGDHLLKNDLESVNNILSSVNRIAENDGNNISGYRVSQSSNYS